MTTNTASGAADLRTAAQAVVDRWDTPLWKDVPATAEYIGRLRAALAAGQATAAQAVVQDDLITIRKPTTRAEMLWLLKLAHLVISDVDKTLEAAFAPAQPAAQQGVAYAALPEPYCNAHDDADACYPDMFSEHQMRAFADRTHTLRAEALAAAYREELDKLSQRNYELRTASRGQAPADAAPSAGAVAGPDDIDAIALTRYKVVHSHDSMFHRFAVVAGDGKQQLYLGRETECQNMTRKFAGAFLDGAFYQSQIAAAPTPAAQAADSVQEDAARYRWLREGNDAKHGAAWYVAVNLYGCEWDAAIDAAMNKGATP